MNKSSPISAVVLTQNEEANIKRCLKSISWVDEIILIDNSIDQTVSLAKKLVPVKKLRILQDKETRDFAKLRNRGLKMAQNEWVLFIDADEQVPQNLSDEIKSIIINTKFDGFYIPRQDFFLGKKLEFGETGKLDLLKLGKKNKGIWQRRVHETWNIKNTGKLSSPLFHYPHPSIAEFLSHINRWTTLDAQEFYDQGVRSDFWKIISYPKAKFVLNYFFKLGFLDGMQGFIMAMLMSFHSYLTRAKLYMLAIQK